MIDEATVTRTDDGLFKTMSSTMVPVDGITLVDGTAFLAASTHEGEDDIVIDAFLRARRVRPDLRLIIAPRHPERGARNPDADGGYRWR